MGSCCSSICDGKRKKKHKKRRQRFPASIVRSVYAATDGHCYYCNRHLGPMKKRKNRWEMDHWTALHNGGKDDPKELVAACFACNRSKSVKTPEAFCAEKGFKMRCRHVDESTGKMCRNRFGTADCGEHGFFRPLYAAFHYFH